MGIILSNNKNYYKSYSNYNNIGTRMIKLTSGKGTSKTKPHIQGILIYDRATL